LREQVIQEILDKKVIAIIRGADEEKALQAARALYEGGVTLVEVTFNQRCPESFQTTQNAIRLIREEMSGKIFVGAGTVTSPALARMAHEAGASYIISPDTNESVIRETRALGMVSIPGAFTPTEAMQAHAFGADFIKLFPCVGDAVSYMKALCAPLNHLKFLAVGGVTSENAVDFIRAGAVGVGVSSSLVKKQWLDEEKYHLITESAKKLLKSL